MPYDPSIRFSWLPRVRWRPIEREVVEQVDLDPSHRWEVLCFSWLNMEIEGYFFRDCGPRFARPA